MAYPTLAETQAYLSKLGGTHSAATVQSVLEAETSAQSRVCHFTPGEMPPDLNEALKRRVARNLALRALPLGVMSDELATRVGGRDPEIHRLEAPYRRVVLG